jgi:molybdate transport system ATP-binding protein
MLDEPFSALDAFLRENMQIELLRIMSEYDGDTILVTHNRDEVYKLCENLLIMEGGRAEARGKTSEVFSDPTTVTAARITGCKNFSEIKRLSEHRLFATDWGIELETAKRIEAEHTHVGVRAHDFSRERSAGISAQNEIAIIAETVIVSPFERTVLFRVANGSGGARGTIQWMCDRNEDVSNTDRLFLNADDILLLTSALHL